MADERTIRGTRHQVKVRNIWTRGQDLVQSPMNSLLAFFPGSLIIVPALISLWNGFKRVQAAAEIAGKEPLDGWLGLLLWHILAPALWAYIQSSLNPIWEAEADPA